VSPVRRGLAAVLLAGTAAFAWADVVVLKGGTVIELKQAWVRRGNTAYITRADGTLLSVPVSEIDRDATAAANQAKPAPSAGPAPAAASPAEAARATADTAVPKARVRITDADVSHPLEYQDPAAPAKPEGASTTAGSGRVEVADYTREKNGAALVVKGSLRNPGQGPAENVRMTITAVDEKGQSIEGTTASLSKGTIDPGTSVEFTSSLNIGDKTVASLRFAPTWTLPTPPPAPAASPVPSTSSGAGGRAAPLPRPTPYGQGSLYAAPAASAPSEAPKDGKTGYIPGASSPDNQPRPPSR
jgi:hypothetical protein